MLVPAVTVIRCDLLLNTEKPQLSSRLMVFVHDSSYQDVGVHGNRTQTHKNTSCWRLIAPSNGTKTCTNNSVIHTKTGPRDDLSFLRDIRDKADSGKKRPLRVPVGSTAQATSHRVLFVGNRRASWRPHACHELEASTIRQHAPISSGARMS
jgi:hypothetical protein